MNDMILFMSCGESCAPPLTCCAQTIARMHLILNHLTSNIATLRFTIKSLSCSHTVLSSRISFSRIYFSTFLLFVRWTLEMQTTRLDRDLSFSPTLSAFVLSHSSCWCSVTWCSSSRFISFWASHLFVVSNTF